MSSHSTPGFRPIRLLYSENPFYVVSCGLVIYGVQVAARGQPTLLGRSLAVTGWMLGYATLMALTVMVVVRVAKVWQDARSIFLIVGLSLAAYTIGYDEISMQSATIGWAFAAAGAGAVLILTEAILWVCRLRLPWPYRLSHYAIFAVLLMSAPVASAWVRDQRDDWANASPLIFSVAIALALLPLIPAMRRRSVGLRHHGSPWRFPLYPLSLFVVLLVVACIRTHAVWMSFSPRGGSVGFEPFLLMPIAAAVILLIGEIDLHRRRGDHAFAIGVAVIMPGVMLLIAGEPGRTCQVPIDPMIRSTAGSIWNVAIIVAVLFEIYHWASGNPVARAMLAIVIGFGALTAQVPAWTGLSPLAFRSIVGILLLLIYWTDLPWDIRSVIATVGLAAAAMWWVDRADVAHPIATAMAISIGGCLVSGAVFQTPIGHGMRQVAAILLVGSLLWSLALWYWGRQSLTHHSMLSGIIATVSLVYLFLVGRRGWVAVCGMALGMLVGIHLHQFYRRSDIAGINLPLVGAAVCFVAGVAVTASKAMPKGDGPNVVVATWRGLRAGL